MAKLDFRIPRDRAIILQNTAAAGGGLRTRNENIVVASGYNSISTGAGNIAGSTPRDILVAGHNSRIRQAGNIVQVQIFIADSYNPGGGDIYFKVWRKDGGTYDKVGEEDVTSKLTKNQINLITLDAPIAVLEGDYIGWKFDSTDETVGSPAYAFGTGIIWFTTAEAMPDVNADFESKGTIALDITTKVYMQAPLMVGIGDSLIAGHTSHYSFIETTDTTVLTNQIMYQLAQLDADIIYQNMGIGSQTSTNVEARFTEDSVDLKPRYTVLLVGVNDIAGAVAKSTYIAKMTAMLDEMASASIVPIILKILPWTNGNNTQMQTRDDWMSDLEILVATYTGSVWVDCDSAIGEFRVGGDPGNLWDIQAIYNDDGVHLNEAGYTKVAETIYALL